MSLSFTEPEIRGLSRKLIILIHAWTFDRRSLFAVRDTVASAEPDADLLLPQYRAGFLSGEDPVTVASSLVDAIGDAVSQRERRGGAYEEIELIGHSLGALLVRKAYVFARGECQDEQLAVPACRRNGPAKSHESSCLRA